MKHSTLNKSLTYIVTLFTTLFLFVLLLGFDLNGFAALLLSIGAGVFMLKKYNSRSSSSKSGGSKLPRLSQEKEAFYTSKGLSKEDIQYFRKTMHKAKEQVMTIETNMAKSGKLKAIENRNNTVGLSKALFKEIANEPDRLHEVDQFLYVHLPSLADLVVKYVEIENHKAKSKATYDILDKSSATIDKMCGQIVEDYVMFKEDDIQDLDVEIELAKRTLDKNL
ncbi:5-bromo-4-chloroindolyl phosphate hydrolysis family protein [Alkalibacterium olivapovliticus]|uniref:5-bromo-4-chloroindolyl phosphate hydrolysis protein n=1 Tax=Alkalibacterium olivapovliticus TaxID=99907 RepID=A0A2T0WBQ5_9LACT|nr:5-bromo-4-chloroindolyl phosphate hydrolysis family protein [Alkalibacterium olivapovliticus]PRY83944.1 5-bromo-4-chloroindolyl phosphate hydrolysis protein [Alkalibacterium olivapovliticus]